MQWVSSSIWTSVAEFISYDDNNYTTGTIMGWYTIKLNTILPNWRSTISAGESGPGSNDNEGVLLIGQRSRSGASLWNCLVPYPGHSLWCFTPLQKCNRCIQQSQLIGLTIRRGDRRWDEVKNELKRGKETRSEWTEYIAHVTYMYYRSI